MQKWKGAWQMLIFKIYLFIPNFSVWKTFLTSAILWGFQPNFLESFFLYLSTNHCQKFFSIKDAICEVLDNSNMLFSACCINRDFAVPNFRHSERLCISFIKFRLRNNRRRCRSNTESLQHSWITTAIWTMLFTRCLLKMLWQKNRNRWSGWLNCNWTSTILQR